MTTFDTFPDSTPEEAQPPALTWPLSMYAESSFQSHPVHLDAIYGIVLVVPAEEVPLALADENDPAA